MVLYSKYLQRNEFNILHEYGGGAGVGKRGGTAIVPAA